MGGERGSGKSVLAVRHNDIYIYIYIYIYISNPKVMNHQFWITLFFSFFHIYIYIYI